MQRCYTVEDFSAALSKMDKSMYTISTRGAGKTRKRYYNIPISFDTEVTNFVSDGHEMAHTYAKMISVDNRVAVLVRTWQDTVTVFNILSVNFPKAIIPVYVHNLAYDFCGLSGWMEWDDIFSIASHTPIRALSKNNIEFRDSLVLFGYKLDTLGSILGMEKKDLEYNKLRHIETELTEEELDYCFRDVEIVVEAIRKEMQEYTMASIPMTKTGYVRKYVREHLRSAGMTIDMVQHLTLCKEEYDVLKEAFCGGFTHSNAYYTGKVIEDVYSYDIITSYIATAVSEYFPMSKGKKVKVKCMAEFVYYLEEYLCVFPITLYNLRVRDDAGDSPISSSKCFNCEDVEEDNGRVYKAKRITTTITSIDLDTILDFYDFESFDVSSIWIYKKGRLPKELVRCLLDLYKKKTMLKGIVGMEDEYNRAKELLNAVYGMMVKDIVQDIVNYKDGVWSSTEPQNAIEDYNKNKNRFLFYPWGVFIAAYSRRNLMRAISHSGLDHIYSDTDSEKFLGTDNCEFFEEYNREIAAKMDTAMEFYGFDKELTRPKNAKGITKQLGAWEREHVYKKFKTLGAKRYLVQTEEDEVILTIAGTQKKSSLIYMLDRAGVKYTVDDNDRVFCSGKIDKLFELFDEDLVIPKEYTGKMTHKYSSNNIVFFIEDYKGSKIMVEERGMCFLEPASYALSMDDKYIRFAMDIQSHRVRKYF